MKELTDLCNVDVIDDDSPTSELKDAEERRCERRLRRLRETGDGKRDGLGRGR